jgi:hypothetical protein
MSDRDKKLLMVVGAVAVLAVVVFVVRGMVGGSGEAPRGPVAPAPGSAAREPVADEPPADEPTRESRRSRSRSSDRVRSADRLGDQPEQDDLAAGEEQEDTSAPTVRTPTRSRRRVPGRDSGRSRERDPGAEDEEEEEEEERGRAAAGVVDA